MKTKALNDIMGIDHVIEIHEDGTITEPSNIWAPTLCDGELESSAWEFFSAGYTGQDRYNGPVMHDSEFIGGRLEDDMRNTPGIYVAIASYYSPETEDDDTEIEGWAIVKLKSA